MKLKKRRKSSRMRGIRTHGHSAKLNKGKGSHGGKGMAGTGKRADHRKSYVINKYGNNYFGKQGETSRSKEKKRIKIINVEEIGKKFEPGEIDLSRYKILGDGEISNKYIIKARAASKSAVEKIKKAGGEVMIVKVGKVEKEESKKKKRNSQPRSK